jgi:hypothetical protein
MSHKYNLKPTPDHHPLSKRPLYHEIRHQLLSARGVMAAYEAPLPDLIDFTPGMAPIRDQGQEGSCAGHQLRNVRWLAHWLNTGSVPAADFSPRFAYWIGSDVEGHAGQDDGITIGDGLSAMEAYGISLESFCPYTPGDLSAPDQAAFDDALTRRVPLQAVPVKLDFASIYQVLCDKHPIIGGFDVPPSFENCPASGLLADPTGEPSLGGHAFSVFMASNKDKWLADDNSWGTGWGKQGVGFMPESYVGRMMECWAIVPAP